jgi:3-phenylpropionate/cinnamic acid dioxygenase small subunit
MKAVMPATERYLNMNALELRFEIEELYADYAACLDEDCFEKWLQFFIGDCVYKIIQREPVGVGERLKFREIICVFDTTLVPNSLIYPL